MDARERPEYVGDVLRRYLHGKAPEGWNATNHMPVLAL